MNGAGSKESQGREEFCEVFHLVRMMVDAAGPPRWQMNKCVDNTKNSKFAAAK